MSTDEVKIAKERLSNSNRKSKPHRADKQRLHFTEVGDLVPIFEKLALVVESKSKLLICKNTVNIVIFNVRFFNIVNQSPELTASVAKHNRIIVCIEKHRYQYSELEK